MDDADVMAAIRGQKAPSVARKAPSSPPTRYDPDDAMIRTVAFETNPNATAAERKAVAAVIANRAHLSGKDYTEVVQEPGQFEPWAARRKDIDAFTPDNPRYAQVKADIADVMAGADPTGGATHFYAPKAQAALKRDKPEFDDGTGVDIGDTRFFKGKYGNEPEAVEPDIMAAIRGEQAQGVTPIGKPSEGAVSAVQPGQKTTAAQDVAFAKLAQGKALDQNAPAGSAQNPFAQVKEGDVPDEPGAYYVSLKGVLERVPGGGIDQKDIQDARAAGDNEKAADLVRQMGDDVSSAFKNRMLSGLLLGGKNEAGAIIHHPLDFLKEGIDAPSIQARIKSSDAADAVQHAQYPLASDVGSITGAGLGGIALSALTGGGSSLPILARLGFAAGEGGLVGGAQGYLGGDGSNAERLKQAGQGAAVGAALGPAGEIAGEGGKMFANKILGLGVSPETATLATNALQKYGIKLRGGQIADSQAVKFVDSVLNTAPFTGYAKKSGEQRGAFTRAVAKTFGEDADNVTPEVMDRARKRIGKVFTDVAKNTSIKDTDVVLTDLAAVVKDAQQVLPESEVAPLLKQVQEIASSIQTDANGVRTMSGDTFQALTRKDSPLSRLTKAGGNTGFYAQKLEQALLDGLTRNAAPGDAAALKEARAQYARMKAIEPLAEKAGPDGQISPALLQSRMAATYDNLAYDGGGDLGELAKIGQRFLKEPPSSGTAERLAAINAMKWGAGLVGAGGALWIAQNPEEAAKKGISAAAIAAALLVSGKLGAATFDNPLYRSLLLRSAKAPPAVVGQGKQLLTAPSVINSTTAGMLSNRLTGEPAPAGQ